MSKRVSAFSELAQLYFPDCTTSKNAVISLNRWIKRCKQLVEELASTGYLPYNHRYLTPKQYHIITHHFGEPFND